MNDAIWIPFYQALLAEYGEELAVRMYTYIRGYVEVTAREACQTATGQAIE